MDSVTVRDLRNHGGTVLDRVQHGEHLIVTRDGTEVAELRPLPRPGLTARELIARRAHLPAVDPAKLQSDIDTVIDAGL